MVCAQVVGNDVVSTLSNIVGSSFELNVMMPVMAYNTLQSIELLSAAAVNFSDRCVVGIRPNLDRLEYLAEASIASCTALAPIIGYDKAAALAKEAFKTGKSIREVALASNVMPEKELDQALNLMNMTKPGLEGGSAGG
jgi:fumarate hydratase class II